MVTRTVFVPANHFGRDVLAYIWQHVSCSFGDIKRVDHYTLSAHITMPERETVKVNRILQKFGLL